MKLLVIGATGSIGRTLVRQALAADHEVTALCRNPDRLEIRHPNLHAITGDVLEPATLEQAMPGHDAVIVALGAGAAGAIRATGTANTIAAMKRCGVNRLVCLSSLGVGDSRGNLNAVWKYLMFGLLLRRAYVDHVEQESNVRASDLDWTIVRPAAYTDGPLTKQFRHGFAADDRELTLKISREDVAYFMLAQLEDDRYLHRAPGLSY